MKQMEIFVVPNTFI